MVGLKFQGIDLRNAWKEFLRVQQAGSWRDYMKPPELRGTSVDTWRMRDTNKTYAGFNTRREAARRMKRAARRAV